MQELSFVKGVFVGIAIAIVVGTISGYGIYVLQKSKTDDQANETTGLSAANDNHKVSERSNSTVTYEPTVTYVTGWSKPESLDGKIWRWAIANDAQLFVSCNALCKQTNKNMELNFGIQSFGHTRDISITIDKEEVWSGTVDLQIKEVTIPLFVKEDNHKIIIEATGELTVPGAGDSRTLSFSLHNLEIRQRP